MKHIFIIPFRDRGVDPLRVRNMLHVKTVVQSFGLGEVFVVSDGRHGSDQFNRSRAYNLGTDLARNVRADIVTYYEADMLVPPAQIETAIRWASTSPGLVIPFSTYAALTPYGSEQVKRGEIGAALAPREMEIAGGKSIGAVNTVSLLSLGAVGQWDEGFSGAWFDDNAMERAFQICCAPTRVVDGYAYHLYHLPGAEGSHLTEEDKAATRRNEQRWKQYLSATTPRQIRALTTEAH